MCHPRGEQVPISSKGDANSTIWASVGIVARERRCVNFFKFSCDARFRMTHLEWALAVSASPPGSIFHILHSEPTMIHSNRFRNVNAVRIKQLRLARNWSQGELGRRAGYSERLVRKAEAGGRLSVDTIADLAEALSTTGELVTPESLECDYLGMAKTVVESYDLYGIEMMPHVSHLLSDDFVWYCPGDPEIAPFAGTWYGVAGLQAWLDIFFGIFRREPGTLETRWTVGSDIISARYEDRLWMGEQALDPFWVNLHFHFRGGLIIRIDDEYDTKAAADSHVAAGQ